ncbi:hypothetical protein [Novosphingobium sp.]|uniref:hypothetical protein n=1 Tax=Novosphingobium sp. TaxID=1874826 RepID=UPI0028A65A0C|nr:hypothetical protein [Novosphingobium sp.]
MTPNPERSERLLALAARCEAAEGPDRDIDRALCPLVSIRVVDEGRLLGRCYYDENGHGVPLPLFTSSLDAAMTLIPAQYRLGTLMEFDSEGRWAAKLFNRGKPGGLPAAGGSSAALAIVVACLRARAGQATPHTAEE